jgi:hypothetical protein
MVRRSVIVWTLATLALVGAREGWADPITLTGSAATDFDPNASANVQVLPIDGNPLNSIAEDPYMSSHGEITGWAVKDLRLALDPKSGTLYVGVNSYGISGDADGNGNPGAGNPNDPAFNGGGAQNLPNFGGTKSITVAFAATDPNHPAQLPTSPLFVAGVPGDKSTAGSGIDGFTVASYAGKNAGIEDNYGAALTGHVGTLAFNPSSTNPSFEFTIPQFTSISGLNPSSGFWVQLYSGSADDGAVGEEKTAWVHVPAFAAESIPEPTTWLAWALLAGGGAAWRRRSASRLGVSVRSGSH